MSIFAGVQPSSSVFASVTRRAQSLFLNSAASASVAGHAAGLVARQRLLEGHDRRRRDVGVEDALDGVHARDALVVEEILVAGAVASRGSRRSDRRSRRRGRRRSAPSRPRRARRRRAPCIHAVFMSVIACGVHVLVPAAPRRRGRRRLQRLRGVAQRREAASAATAAWRARPSLLRPPAARAAADAPAERPATSAPSMPSVPSARLPLVSSCPLSSSLRSQRLDELERAPADRRRSSPGRARRSRSPPSPRSRAP